MENPDTWNKPTKLIADVIMQHMMRTETPGLSLPRAIHDALESHGFLIGLDFTERQVQILDCLCSDGTNQNKEIAAKLHLSHVTIKNHLTAAFKKLGVNSRLKASIAWRKIRTEKAKGAGA